MKSSVTVFVIIFALIGIVAVFLTYFSYPHSTSLPYHQVTNTPGLVAYTDPDYGFALEYPSDWVTPAGLLHGSPDYAGHIVFSTQDPERRSTEPGGYMYPVFTVSVYPSVQAIPPMQDYLQALPEEISVSTDTLQVYGSHTTQYLYKSFAVEGASNITRRVVLPGNNKVYIIEMGYTLSGCDIMPEAFRTECEAQNRLIENKSRFFWSNMVSSFNTI